RAERVELRFLDVAVPLDEARTARVEPARARRVDRARDVALEHDRLPLAPQLRVRDRYRGEQRARVRMLRLLVENVPARNLGNLAEVHHEHAARDVADDVEV